MNSYCVNANAQANGDHEVHMYSCTKLPNLENRIYLGEFSSCTAAVQAAKKRYPRSDGCALCCPACHIR
jgi:hypothetical protein